jgi:hypothetical protein
LIWRVTSPPTTTIARGFSISAPVPDEMMNGIRLIVPISALNNSAQYEDVGHAPNEQQRRERQRDIPVSDGPLEDRNVDAFEESDNWVGADLAFLPLFLFASDR